MTTMTTTRIADTIADCLAVCLRYGRLLAEDVPADQFTDAPRPGMNHPAFLLGHIALVTGRALHTLDRKDLADDPEPHRTLFAAGCPRPVDRVCFPSKDEIVQFYVTRHEDAITALRAAPDDAFRCENPADGDSRAMFPTVGALVNFVVNCHHMTHLGQLSAWRRAMGLKPVLGT